MELSCWNSIAKEQTISSKLSTKRAQGNSWQFQLIEEAGFEKMFFAKTKINLLSPQGSRFKQQPGLPGGSDRPDPLLHPAQDQLSGAGRPLLLHADRRPQDSCCCRAPAAGSSRCCPQADCSQVHNFKTRAAQQLNFRPRPGVIAPSSRRVAQTSSSRGNLGDVFGNGETSVKFSTPQFQFEF